MDLIQLVGIPANGAGHRLGEAAFRSSRAERVCFFSEGSYFVSANRPLAAKPSRDLLFIKLWAALLRMPEMEKA